MANTSMDKQRDTYIALYPWLLLGLVFKSHSQIRDLEQLGLIGVYILHPWVF